MVVYIRGFADSRSNIQSKLGNNSAQIVEHLACIMLYPNSTSIRHWKIEIAHFINEVSTLKGKNKLPKSSDIYEWTYGTIEHLISSRSACDILIENIINKENLDVEISDYEKYEFFTKINYVCEEYFSWLSKKLSREGNVNSSEIYNFIDKLIYN